jgi:hypothetical protein
MIRGSDRVAETPELTKQILQDSRLPLSDVGITHDQMLAMAEVQRQLDVELGRQEYIFSPPDV